MIRLEPDPSRNRPSGMRFSLTLLIVLFASEQTTAGNASAPVKSSDDVIARRLAQLAMKKGHKALAKRVKALRKSLGDVAVASLIARLLTHDDPDVKAAAAFVIGSTNIKTKAALPALIKAINDTLVSQTLDEYGAGRIPGILVDVVIAQPERRFDAGFALTAVGGDPKSAVPKLIGALRSKDNELRYYASGILGDMGPAAKDAVGALITIVKSRPAMMFAAAPLLLSGKSASNRKPLFRC